MENNQNSHNIFNNNVENNNTFDNEKYHSSNVADSIQNMNVSNANNSFDIPSGINNNLNSVSYNTSNVVDSIENMNVSNTTNGFDMLSGINMNTDNNAFNNENYNSNNIVNPNQNNKVSTPNYKTDTEQFYGLKKKKTGNRKFLIIGGILLFIFVFIVVIVGIFKNFNSKEIADGDFGNGAFFFGENKKYALISKSGKKLTDYEFTDFEDYSFEDNKSSAIVQNDKDYGIVSINGQMLIDFQEYSYIRRCGVLYTAQTSNNNYVIINDLGEVLNITGNCYKFGEKFSLVKTANEQFIMDKNGNTIYSFPGKGATAEYLSVSENYMTVMYENMVYVIDIENKKLVISFESENKFIVYSVSANKKEIVLESSDGLFYQEKYIYKYIKDGKVLFTKEYPNSQVQHILFRGNSLILTPSIYSKEEYILDSSGNVIRDVSLSSYVDEKNYVMNNPENDDYIYHIYVNNDKKVNTNCTQVVTGVGSGYAKYGFYIFRDCKDYSFYHFKIYKMDGTLLGVYYDGTEVFDENVINIRTPEKKEYLMDANGKIFTDEYDSIIQTSGGLFVATKDKKKYLLSETGKELTFGDKIEEVSFVDNQGLFVIITRDNKNIVYNIKDKKEVISFEEKIKPYQNYFIVGNGTSTKYYSYLTGKAFYEK